MGVRVGVHGIRVRVGRVGRTDVGGRELWWVNCDCEQQLQLRSGRARALPVHLARVVVRGGKMHVEPCQRCARREFEMCVHVYGCVAMCGRRDTVQGARQVHVHEQDGLRAIALLQGVGRTPCSMCPWFWA